MTNFQKAKFDQLYKAMINGKEYRAIHLKNQSPIKSDDEFHALVMKIALSEVA